MFISKRKYESDIHDAEMKGYYSGREEASKEYRMNELIGEVEKLKQEVALLKGPNEGSTGEKDTATIPLAY